MRGPTLVTGLVRQSVFSHLVGYEVANVAGCRAHHTATRAKVDRTGVSPQAVSTSRMVHFETGWLTNQAHAAALVDLSSDWIDRMHARRPRMTMTLDMDSSL